MTLRRKKLDSKKKPEVKTYAVSFRFDSSTREGKDFFETWDFPLSQSASKCVSGIETILKRRASVLNKKYTAPNIKPVIMSIANLD